MTYLSTNQETITSLILLILLSKQLDDLSILYDLPNVWTTQTLHSSSYDDPRRIFQRAKLRDLRMTCPSRPGSTSGPTAETVQLGGRRQKVKTCLRAATFHGNLRGPGTQGHAYPQEIRKLRSKPMVNSPLMVGPYPVGGGSIGALRFPCLGGSGIGGSP